MRKRILLVAMPNSIHVVRWIRQLEGQDWDIHLFPSIGGDVIHPDIANVTIHHLFYSKYRPLIRINYPVKPSKLSQRIDIIRSLIIEKRFPSQRIKQLSRVINQLKPDIIHSLEIQAAGYLTLESKNVYKGNFPPWIVTNWGSDIFLFGRLQQHKVRIGKVLANCDYYSCECERDIELAKQFGFNGTTMPVFPNTGGFNLARLNTERHQIPTSVRKLIMLKGYQNWAGRALVGLRALARCKDLLDGYSVAIYSASPDVEIAAELFTDETGIPTKVIPKNTQHQEMLSLHAQARISIGLSISDAISTSFLEAIVMGSFPIQSCTACVGEWVEHGVSGMIVPPEDSDVIEIAIRRALSDDRLVDEASDINWVIAQERLDDNLLKLKAINMYSDLLYKK